MITPLFHKSIPLLPEQDAPGFYELSFKSLYDSDVLSCRKKQIGASLLQVEFHLLIDQDFSVAPTVLVCDRKTVKQRGNEGLACNGVYVLVDTNKNKKGKYDVAVGRHEITEGDKEHLTLIERIGKLVEVTEPYKIKNWNKAILICDWERDIKDRSANKSKPKADVNEKISKVFNDEIFHLANFFHDELNKSKALNLNVHGTHRDSYYLPNPDLLRYDYYVGVVKKLLSMIIANEI